MSVTRNPRVMESLADDDKTARVELMARWKHLPLWKSPLIMRVIRRVLKAHEGITLANVVSESRGVGFAEARQEILYALHQCGMNYADAGACLCRTDMCTRNLLGAIEKRIAASEALHLTLSKRQQAIQKELLRELWMVMEMADARLKEKARAAA